MAQQPRREIDINILGNWIALLAVAVFVVAIIMGYVFGI